MEYLRELEEYRLQLGHRLSTDWEHHCVLIRLSNRIADACAVIYTNALARNPPPDEP